MRNEKVHKGLTPAGILEVSFGLVDAGGPDALSMRELARQLGVAPMAVYNHFSGRDAILDALAEQVFASFPTAAPAAKRSGNWKKQLRAILMGAHDLACRHPHVYRLALTRPNKPASAFRLTEEALRLLHREAGLSRREAFIAYHTFVMMLHGFPFWREGVQRMPEGGDTGQLFAQSIEWLLGMIGKRAGMAKRP